MISFKKFPYLLSIGIICFTILSVLKLYENHFILFLNSFYSSSTIIYQTFNCHTWKNFSYVNPSRYHECLGWNSDVSFWNVQGLRHTAHKNLLNSSSLIIEVGGNRGHDTVEFIKLYDPSIISYEPLISMWTSLTKQFQSNPKIEIRPYGLGNRVRKVSVEPYDNDNAGTSIFRQVSAIKSPNIEQIQLLDVVQVIRDIQKIRKTNKMIDMISINCEGCEFEILPALIMNNMTQYFRIIQFATHVQLLLDSSCIYCQIEEALKRTHKILYHYTKLWEGWILISNTTN